MKFKDKVVLVTGGSSGIGEAVSDAFFEEGAKVIVMDINSCKSEYEYHKVDIRNEEDIETAISKLSAVDILINNAGVYLQKDVENTSKKELDLIIDTNVKGTYLTTKHVLPLIRKSKGNIINISSGLGVVPELSSPAYCMTKSAIIMFTKVLAQDLAGEGIRVNSVLPGPIDTPMLRKAFATEAEYNECKKLNPMKKIGNPIDVASVVLFLASSEANYVTGGIYSIDGGESTSSLYSK